MSDEQEQLLQDVIVRATIDAAFRKRLLKEARSAIRDEFGVTIPRGHEIRFIERPHDVDTLIVLPDLNEPTELDDDDLEAAAGGTDTNGEW